MNVKSYVWLLLRPPMPALLLVSCLAWAMMALNGHQHHSLEHEAHHHHGAVPAVEYSIAGFGGSAVASWLVMIVAMMLPLLCDALRQLWGQSLPRLRVAGVVVFLVGYLACWLLAGVAIHSLMVVLELGRGWAAPLLPASVIAAFWQASPWKQVSLNHCHFLQRIHPFGMRYYKDCLIFSLRKGRWCVASCWALMLVPMVSDTAALPLMLVVGLMMFIEQLQTPKSPGWRNPLELFAKGGEVVLR